MNKIRNIFMYNIFYQLFYKANLEFYDKMRQTGIELYDFIHRFSQQCIPTILLRIWNCLFAHNMLLWSTGHHLKPILLIYMYYMPIHQWSIRKKLRDTKFNLQGIQRLHILHYIFFCDWYSWYSLHVFNQYTNLLMTVLIIWVLLR